MTAELFSELFRPLHLGSLTIPNRVALATINTGFATLDGFVTEHLIRFHRQIATGEVGLSIVGSTTVSPEGLVNFNGLRIDDDRFIPGLKKLFLDIWSQGSAPAIQIMHAGRQTSSAVTGMQPVAPSPLPSPSFNEMPRELTTKEISEIVEDFGSASIRAKEAGAGAIEIHAAHGYLIHEFLSPYSNKRVDEYGGDFNNRLRFLEEIVEKVKLCACQSTPLIVRLSAIEFAPGGLELHDAVAIAKRLETLGVDLLSLSAGNYGCSAERIYPTSGPEMYERADWTRIIKEETALPVLAGGRVEDLFEAQEFVRRGRSDMVAMARPLIADPHLVKKSRQGEFSKIVKCTWTNFCRYPSPLENSCLRCVVNPNL